MLGRLVQNVREHSMQWTVSILAHVLVLSMLAMFYIEGRREPKVATVVTDLSERIKEEDFQELIAKDEVLSLDAPVSLTPSGGKGAIGAAPGALANPVQSSTQATAAASAAATGIGSRNLTRPLAGRIGNIALDSTIAGLKGISESVGGAGGSGDEGAVQRISQELLRQISKNKCLVVWILDSSGSLADRRKSIADRLDRVYKEMEALGVVQNGALLSAVAAVGAQTKFVLDKPTDDVEKIRKAFRDVKDDQTGQENLFQAMRDAALKYRRFQTSGGRTLILVLVTDEIGDDAKSTADEAVKTLKRNHVPVYVLGPEATFNRPVIHDLWIDPKTKFRFYLPIERGPYTRIEEVLRVAFQDRAYNSGFGPFGLTQLTRETGGIYFLFGDERVAAFQPVADVLMRYKANYGTADDLQVEINKSDFRRTLMEVVDAGNKIWGVAWPYQWIDEQRLKESMESRQREAAVFTDFARTAIPKMQTIAPLLAKEPSVRWQADYLLSMARLLQAKVRCDEFQASLAEFRKNPPTLADPKKNNGWRVEWIAERSADAKTKGGTKASAKEASKSGGAKVAAKSLSSTEMVAASQSYYDRVIQEHAGTPFAAAAAAEKSNLVGVKWVEGFNPDFIPPKDEGERAKVKPPKR